MAGTLYLVATPIGNLGDLSPRAVETLRTADFIAAEDTRVSLRLLNHFDIRKPLVDVYKRQERPGMRGVLHSHTSDAEKAPESAITPFPPAPGPVKTTGPGAVFLWGPTRFSHPRKSPLTNGNGTAIIKLFIKLFGENPFRRGARL